MRAHLRRRSRGWAPGGILTYATARLHEEVAYVAYHFHWSLDDILDLDHHMRLCYVDEIARINRKRSEGR